MGLVELGRHTGLSAAMLSKVERGKLFPTPATHLRMTVPTGATTGSVVVTVAGVASSCFEKTRSWTEWDRAPSLTLFRGSL